MIDLLNDENIADAMTTVANCLLAQARIPADEPERGSQIDEFKVDVNEIRIVADGKAYRLKVKKVG